MCNDEDDSGKQLNSWENNNNILSQLRPALVQKYGYDLQKMTI